MLLLLHIKKPKLPLVVTTWVAVLEGIITEWFSHGETLSIKYLSLYFYRQCGAWAAAHLQPDWPLWHFDPVCASGRPHSCNTDRPHRVVPCKCVVDLFPVMLNENDIVVLFPCWILCLCLSTGTKSHPADVVPHQVFQLVASHCHRSHSAHLHQHAGDICS